MGKGMEQTFLKKRKKKKFTFYIVSSLDITFFFLPWKQLDDVTDGLHKHGS